jgi:hypothetical protein
MPYATQNLAKAQALTDINQNPYQQYQGDRIAGFNPLQTQAMSNVANMQVSPALGAGMGLAGLSGVSALGAGSQYNQMATNPYAMQAFMSPYQQNVTDWQKQQAVMDYGRQLPGMQAQATNAGAFGGSRQAIVESEAQRNLQNQLAGIQASGTQNAFQNAQQAQQFGANLGLQGAQTGLQAAQGLGQLGMQNYQQLMGINQAQQLVGAQAQAQEQQLLSQQYQDFLNQQNYPYKQLGFMSDLIRGTPTSGGAQTMYQAPPSGMSQTIGLLGGLGSLYGAYDRSNKQREGGEIKGYNAGGEVRPFAMGGPAELDAVQKMPPLNPQDPQALGALLNTTARSRMGIGDLIALKQEADKVKQLQAIQQQVGQSGGIGSGVDRTVADDMQAQIRAALYPEQAQQVAPQQQVAPMQQIPAQMPQGKDPRMTGVGGLDAGSIGGSFAGAGGGIVAFAGGAPVEAKGKPTDPYVRAMQEAGPFSALRDTDVGRWIDTTVPSPKRILDTIGATTADVARLPTRLAFEEGTTDPRYKTEGWFPILSSLVGDKNQGAEMPPGAAPDKAGKTDTTRGVELASHDESKAQGVGVGASDQKYDYPPVQRDIAGPSAGAGTGAGAGARTGGEGATDDQGIRGLIAQTKAARDKLLKDADTQMGKRPETRSLTDYLTEVRGVRDAALEAAGVSKTAYADRLKELKESAAAATKDRDVDRWLAAAQGFFSMAAGKSRYAVQNIAEGLNMGVKEFKEVEKEYRKTEEARKERIALLEEAKRKEALGDATAAMALRDRAEDKQFKHDEAKSKLLVHLAEHAGHDLTRLTTAYDNNETRKAMRAAASETAGASRAATAANREAALMDARYKTILMLGQKTAEDVGKRRQALVNSTEGLIVNDLLKRTKPLSPPEQQRVNSFRTQLANLDRREDAANQYSTQALHGFAERLGISAPSAAETPPAAPQGTLVQGSSGERNYVPRQK